jgi:hypothetical protein
VKDFIGRDGGVAPFVAAAAWALLPALGETIGPWFILISFVVLVSTLSARTIAASVVPLVVPLCATEWRYSAGAWLVAALCAALSFLAITRRHGFGDAGDRNLTRIASWLMLVAAITIALDPAKRLSLALGALTWLCGAILFLRAALRRHRRRVFFAAIARGEEGSWRIGAGHEPLPALFDPPGSMALVLFERLPATGGPYRPEINERPIARVGEFVE